jgi:phosphohistidine swiveling domain-containing protein
MTRKNGIPLNKYMKKFILKGKVANLGCVQGIANVIKDPSDFVDFKHNQILVVPEFKEELLPLIAKSKAVIIEVDTQSQALKQACQEVNIPCAVKVKKAIKILQDGIPLEVDCNNPRFAKIDLLNLPHFKSYKKLNWIKKLFPKSGAG